MSDKSLGQVAYEVFLKMRWGTGEVLTVPWDELDEHTQVYWQAVGEAAHELGRQQGIEEIEGQMKTWLEAALQGAINLCCALKDKEVAG